MPHALIVVAQWVGSAVLAATPATIGTGTAIALTEAAVVTTYVAEVVALAAISKALMPKVGGDFGSQVDFKADPRGGIPYAVGRTGTAGNIIYTDTAGSKNKYLNYVVVLSGAGPIESYEGFYVNDNAVTFGADSGEGASGYYLNRMWQVRQLGATPESDYLHWTATGSKDTPADHFGMPSTWTSAHKLSGLAAYLWGLEFNNADKYSAGTPKPLSVIKGVKVYDPRLDSTYPGGTGSHRAGDESTYAWSENPYLHALTWCIGRFQNGVRVMGVGAALDAIDIPAFVEGANIAEANGWTVGGVVYSTDDKFEVLKAFLQAGGGKPMRLGAKISCLVNTPRTSLATLTGADVVGRVSVAGTIGRRSRINTIWPQYRDEAQNWQMVTADEPITVSDYYDPDRGQRSTSISYALVQGVDQAAQLARYDIEDSREFTPITLPCKPRWLGYRPGDVITVDEPEYGLNSQPVLILQRRVDPATMMVTLTCRSETTGKHAFALGQIGVAPPTPGLTGYDPNVLAAPNAPPFAATGGTVTGASGKVPALIVTGESDNGDAAQVLVRYRIAGETEWIYWAAVPAGAVEDPIRIEITGVADGTDYEIEVAYRSWRGVVSGWTALGTHTAGVFEASSIYAFLWTIEPNLTRFDMWTPGGGTTSVGVPPAAPFTDFGDQQMAYQMPGGSATPELRRTGAIYNLITNDVFATYSLMAKVAVDSGTATLRIGAFQAGTNTPVSGIATQVYAITTTPTVIKWEGVNSADAAFSSVEFCFHLQGGDLAGGQALTLTDIQQQYNALTVAEPWRPSPDEDNLTRYSSLIGDLMAAKRVASAGQLLRVTPDGQTHEYAPYGPASVVNAA